MSPTSISPSICPVCRQNPGTVQAHGKLICQNCFENATSNCVQGFHQGGRPRHRAAGSPATLCDGFVAPAVYAQTRLCVCHCHLKGA
jgi:hypothetical protein